MKKILEFFGSLKLMLILIAIYAICIGVATFIENDYGVETAWAVVYTAKWFELLQLVLAINLLFNIYKFKMYEVKKLPMFMFHIAFLVILLGSAMTRYMGYEGTMSIREQATENRMLSSEAFLQIKAKKGLNFEDAEHSLYLSKITQNNFSYDLKIDGETINVKYKDLVNNAVKTAVESKDGKPLIKYVISSQNGNEEYFIGENESTDFGGFAVYYEKAPDINRGYIHMFKENGQMFFKSNTEVGWYEMATKKQGRYKVNEPISLTSKRVYYIPGFKFAISGIFDKAVIKVIPKDEYLKTATMPLKKEAELSALVVDVSYKGETKEVALMGLGKNFRGYAQHVKFDDLNVELEWGAKIITLPFSLYLKKFILTRYAGSNSPSSYESEVILLDERKLLQENFRIYMNNTLTHDGYTFYQSSYDKDEKGTVLSVNNDPGKWPTYLGYFLLIFGLVLNLVNPHSRFGNLVRTKHVSAKKIAGFLLFALVLGSMNQPLHAYTQTAQPQNNKTIDKNSREYINTLSYEEIVSYVSKVDLEHSKKFSRLLIQTNDGRVKPIDTYALNAVNKMLGTSSMFGLTYNQVFTGMVTRAKYWQKLKLFKVKHPKIKEILGISKESNRFSYLDVFTADSQYKLNEAANESIRKKPANRGTFEKEIIKIDEKLNVAYSVFEGIFFKVFPKMSSKDDAWYNAQEVFQRFSKKNQTVLAQILKENKQGILEGYEKGNWTLANSSIAKINEYQKNNASSEVLANNSLIEAELLYNRLGIFEKLFPLYLVSGIILLFFIFVRLAKPNSNFKLITKVVLGIIVATFIVHTFNLGLRWYVAGHAPWSNSYEAMLYISWSIILAGLLFAKQSDFAISTTSMFAGITLFVAHLSWLDPQITNLVPVLKSYWLTIHVSVITASYGFLGLSALLGFITLVLYIIACFIKEELVKEQIVTNIKEAVRINEISMTIGITLLISGNFLGGIWANESWGRYWGWDPKETWTLVTILVYALIIHLRYVPKLKSIYLFSVLSLVSYGTVLMTYFGVNYYLSGLHSYAGGDPIPIPVWVYYAIASIGILIIAAYKNRNMLDLYKTTVVKKEK